MNEFDPFARYYDADYAEYNDDIAFYRELARRVDGPVLEVMCGSGRVLLPLARDGHRVAGLDVSPAMLALAAERLAAAGLSARATLIEADATNWQLDQSFDLAIVALNSFMHLPDAKAQLAALERIRAHLNPGGLLALDLFNPDPRMLIADEGALVFDKSFRLPDGQLVQKFVVQQRDWATQTQRVTFVYDRTDADGLVRRESLPFVMRWLYRYELEHLLARAGLRLDALYGSYELEPYASDSPQLLAVAVRP
jgi:SAM-dependent methyltransferase